MTTSKRAHSKPRAHREDSMGETVAGAAKNAGEAVNGAAEAIGLSDRVAAHPYGMVAAAIGIGYVAGGGLFTATTARVIELGLKLASVPFVRGRLIDIAENAVEGVLQQTRKVDSK